MRHTDSAVRGQRSFSNQERKGAQAYMVLFLQKRNSFDSYKAAQIDGKFDDLTSTSIDEPFSDFIFTLY